ncbi:MAG: DUF3536 domain-containing protein [Anaerolineae bacterium]|nr:DUF3536 domain-containing protein [Anaerolineae bacterium]
MSRFRYLCIHGHFDQPPRGNPLTGHIGEEASAGEYRNWNERATAESYRPNAEIGNFEHISFDLGPSLLNWLQQRHPNTYQQIKESYDQHRKENAAGNGLGTPMYHAILPLLKPRDIRLQLVWGRYAFTHHFGYEPQGLWLPEMAVDPITLRIAHEIGYKYVILAEGQVHGVRNGSGPYWIDLGDDQRIAAFVRNDELSNDLSFNIATVGGAGHWARNRLPGPRGQLTLIAIDGETFGHHHIGEEQFLHWLLAHEAASVGYRVVTLDQYLQEFPPQEYIEVKPFSSWSCYHGVNRWFAGCACTEGDSTWKPALSLALERAADVIDDLYAETAFGVGLVPRTLREEYIQVLLGEIDGLTFLRARAPHIGEEDAMRLLGLLEAQSWVARSLTSDGMYGADFDCAEGRSVIVSMGYALLAAERATGEHLIDTYRNALQQVRSGITGTTGQEIFDALALEYGMITPPTPADQADMQPETLPDPV